MIIRVQSSEGIKRIEVKESASLTSLLSLVANEYDLQDGVQLFSDRAKTLKVSKSRKLLKSAGIKHGDIFYLDLPKKVEDGAEMDVDGSKGEDSPVLVPKATNGSNFASSRTRNESTASMNSNLLQDEVRYSTSAAERAENVPEDEIDVVLKHMDGRILRERDERACRHGANGKCLHCTPIEPFDESYLKSRNPPIKYLSFHSYLRKINSGVSKGKFAVLREPNLKIKSGCSAHAPYPEGICTKCQPKPLTLNSQVYRHVDLVSFENASIIDRFLTSFRASGVQRCGLMYGVYEKHPDVPLGIKAVVKAIYEPPQNSDFVSISFLDDANAETVDLIASRLGMRKIGWVFTDLEALDLQKGTVKNFRGEEKYFLSAEECLQSGYFQCSNPNPCQLSPTGYFGSKFVTVVLHGDNENNIKFDAYQVSNQCAALVRDNCIVPTLDAPELAYVRESSNQQYVPEVNYKKKNEYGYEIIQAARPCPVEYFIIDIPASVPKEPIFSFISAESFSANRFTPINLFPIENRMFELQNASALKVYLNQFNANNLKEAFKDFHVLCYLATTSNLTVQLNDEELIEFIEALKTDNLGKLESFFTGEYWSTLRIILDNSEELGVAGAEKSGEETWACPHCTFINKKEKATCEICSLPPGN